MFKEKVCHIGRIIMILSLIFTVSSEFGHAQINDPPEIMNLAADFVMYIQGDGAVLLDARSDAFVIDVDNPDFDGGRLEVQIITGFGQFEDVLYIMNQGTDQISSNGTEVSYGGTKIGTVMYDNNTGLLNTELNNNATPESVSAMIRNLIYENTDMINPTEGDRTIQFVLYDGDGGISDAYHVTVSVFASSTPSGQLSVTPPGSLTSSGGKGGPFSPSSQTYTLTNTGDASINWTASAGQPWMTLSPTSGTLAAGGSETVTVSINDNANTLAAGSYSDTVNFTNTTNGSGNTTSPVSLTVDAEPGILSVTPADDLDAEGVKAGRLNRQAKHTPLRTQAAVPLTGQYGKDSPG